MLYLAVKRKFPNSLTEYEFMLDHDKQVYQFQSQDSAEKYLMENGIKDFSELSFEWRIVVYKDNLIEKETHLVLESVFNDYSQTEYYHMDATADRRILYYITTLGSFDVLTPKMLNKLLILLDEFEKGKL